VQSSLSTKYQPTHLVPTTQPRLDVEVQEPERVTVSRSH
jgi:hypothetical protein